MRVYLTGGSGFVGSNVAHLFSRRHGAEVIAPRHAEVDLVDPAAVRHSVEAARPDAVVHCAILNDWGALTARRRTVWDGDGLNRLATPVLAGHAAEMMWRALEGGVSGILHCCGGEHIDRVGLARRAVDAFALDPALLDVVPPPTGALPPGRVPVDTRLAAARTAERLDMRLPSVDDLLTGLRSELDDAGRGAQAT